ncbi:hypothetical protein AG1IA_08164 [Rhizoctonia solani AG-1 IA]|uniref:Uncharacterized protein n=1 Tax=Thanatephorus cucumeris (strain AG1-IA) TaxID=983506 RepID=L8WHY7_THACA|nr:hypothetical protein AG1IA_08164 [Rhizoctonia solani AG-1 IA]
MNFISSTNMYYYCLTWMLCTRINVIESGIHATAVDLWCSEGNHLCWRDTVQIMPLSGQRYTEEIQAGSGTLSVSARGSPKFGVPSECHPTACTIVRRFPSQVIVDGEAWYT